MKHFVFFVLFLAYNSDDLIFPCCTAPEFYFTEDYQPLLIQNLRKENLKDIVTPPHTFYFFVMPAYVVVVSLNFELMGLNFVN